MASFRKHGTKWRVQVERKGKRASKIFTTKQEAKTWANLKELEFSDPASFVAENKKVYDLFNRYADEVSPIKKGHRWEVIRLKKFNKHSLAKLKIGNVTSDDITNWKNEQLKRISPASVNREMNLISAVFQTALTDWKWITKNPVHGVSRPKSNNARDRRISIIEIKQILSELKFNDEIQTKSHQVAVMFLIALETAMRLGEIHGLNESDVNLQDRYVVLRDTKNNDTRQVPLSLEAVRLFKSALPNLFTVSKASAGVLFKKATVRAGIENLRFHDSRHEAITNLARKIDVLDLARMIGHRDPKSLMTYYNATATEIASRLD